MTTSSAAGVGISFSTSRISEGGPNRRIAAARIIRTMIFLRTGLPLCGPPSARRGFARRIGATGPSRPSLGATLVGAELRPIQRAELAFHVPLVAVDAKEALRELERRVHRRRLEHRVAADHFLGLGERTFGRGELSAVPAHALALGGRTQPGGGDEPPLARRLLHQLAHLGHQPLAGLLPALFFNTDHRKESHRLSPGLVVLAKGSRTAGRRFDISDDEISGAAWIPDYGLPLAARRIVALGAGNRDGQAAPLRLVGRDLSGLLVHFGHRELLR